MGTKQSLLQAVLDADMDEAMRQVELWSAEHGLESVHRDLLNPMLESIGDLIQNQEIALAQSYVAAKVAENTLETYAHTITKNDAGDTRGPVVLGNIEDDCHPLGRKIVASFLRACSWEVCDLGVDVEAENFVDKAIEIGAKVVGVSAMTFTTAAGIQRVRQVIDERNLASRVKLAVGGAAFRRRPELAEKLGADGMASDALEADALFTRLWAEAVAEEEQPDER